MSDAEVLVDVAVQTLARYHPDAHPGWLTSQSMRTPGDIDTLALVAERALHIALDAAALGDRCTYWEQLHLGLKDVGTKRTVAWDMLPESLVAAVCKPPKGDFIRPAEQVVAISMADDLQRDMRHKVLLASKHPSAREMNPARMRFMRDSREE